MTFRSALRSLRLPGAVLAVTALAWPAFGRRPLVQEEVKPGLPDKGAISLFSGKAEDIAANWLKRGSETAADWKLADQAVVARGGDIVTRAKFNDFQLHVEFRTPDMPEAKGQAKGNSGIFCQGRYEVQVLDSYGLADVGKGDCGSIYNKAAPLINACRPPREWQTFNITFRAPRFDASGTRTENARVNVILNGIVVQNNTSIDGPTWGETFGGLNTPGPIVLQDHGNNVEYRNIWIRPLPSKGVDRY